MPENLYRSYSLEKSADSISGSLTLWEDSPSSPYDIGGTFQPVPGGPRLKVSKVNISDNVIGERNGKPYRQWQIVVEGNTEESSVETNIKYSFSISSEEKSGTMEVVQKGNSPSISLNIGETFNVPGIGNVKCTAIKGNDSYNENGIHVWTTSYEGVMYSGGNDDENPSLPDTEITISYELNGITTRTVAGEFLALMRSSTPITKKTITVYNNSVSAISSPGGTYEGGIVLSENIEKETIKVNGVTTNSYYKHSIEVES